MVKKKTCIAELYSEYNGSSFYEDRVACTWLKENGYLVENDYVFTKLRPNKKIIVLCK
jgi:hypothetical protein